MFASRGFYFYIVVFCSLLLNCITLLADERPEPPNADTPRISPDGTRIVFVSRYQSDIQRLWLINRDGTKLRLLSPNYRAIQLEPDWSPDGQYIVYRSTNNQLWRVNSDGNNAVALVEEGNNSYPRYSPNGSTIMFRSDRNGKRELWFMDADGGNQRPANIPTTIARPNWSPDGGSLVYTRCQKLSSHQALSEKNCHIFTYNLSTKNELQLTSGDRYDSEPDWGDKGIIFRSNYMDTHNLWLVDGDGKNLREIVNRPGIPFEPQWDSTNNTIIFSQNSQIWSTDLYGNESQITHLQPNKLPVAVAGNYSPAECTSAKGAVIKLDGRQSYDPNGEAIRIYGWNGPFGVVRGATPLVDVPLGNHEISLYIESGVGQESTDTTVLTVQDTRPPMLSKLEAFPDSLWPPNHQMVEIALQLEVADVCSSRNTCRILSVKSNEAENYQGDGDSTPDWSITDTLALQLRAERSATGNGRVYRITVECTDESGNTGRREVEVIVPVSKGNTLIYE